MKKLTSLFIAVWAMMLAFTFSSNAQTVFALQNGSRTQFYTTLSTAISNIQDGDTLYLPGKPLNGDYTFSKKVTIIGAGYDADSAAATGITKFTGKVYFAKKSKGSSMTGVRTEGRVYVQDSSITITRCNMESLEIQNGNNPIGFVYVGDCIISSVIEGCNDVVTNVLVERCILNGNIGSGNKTNNLLIKNCVLTYTGNYFLSNISNLIFQNSIFLITNDYYFIASSSSLTFNHNLFVRPAFSNISFVMTGNIFGVPENDIFVDAASGNYHIKPTCTQALTLATDGKEVGIYGTDNPFLVPTFAPRFISINNAESTKDGKLSVKMTVEARNR
ncbi:MAG: hypothetical protein KBG17_02830 [Paludibacteraceae bacterium]|nr:hypothetical protein [Paludibacteraceae bacterium]